MISLVVSFDLASHGTVLKIPAIAEQEEKIQIGPDKYHVRRVGDVLHAEREPLSVLEPIRTFHPEQFAAQYQQAPLLPGGVIVKRTLVRYYDALPLQAGPSRATMPAPSCLLSC